MPRGLKPGSQISAGLRKYKELQKAAKDLRNEKIIHTKVKVNQTKKELEQLIKRGLLHHDIQNFRRNKNRKTNIKTDIRDVQSKQLVQGIQPDGRHYTLITTFVRQHNAKMKKINSTSFLYDSFSTTRLVLSGEAIVISYTPIIDIPITEATLNYVSNTCNNKALELLNKHNNTSIKMRIVLGESLSDSGDVKHKTTASASVVIDNQFRDDTTKNKLNGIVMKNWDTNNYFLYVKNVDYFINSLGNSGGCQDKNTKTNSHPVTIYENGEKKEVLVIVKSLKSTKNNCLLQCFMHHLKKDHNKIKLSTVRKELEFEQNTLLTLDDSVKVGKYFNCSFIIYNQSFEMIKSFNIENNIDDDGSKLQIDNVLSIMLMDQHYHYIDDVRLYKNCEYCNKQLRYENDTHECSESIIKYNQMMENKKQILDNTTIFEKYVKKCKNVLNYEDVIHFDLETFPENNTHVPYACGYIVNNEYNVDYGKDCMYGFIDTILDKDNTIFFDNLKNKKGNGTYSKSTNVKKVKVPKAPKEYDTNGKEIRYTNNRRMSIINAYNGSSFDFQFLMTELTARNIPIKNLIYNKGKLMGFQFGKASKIVDLCLFINSSLSKACKSYKLDVCKTEFDHNKMKSWEDVETHKTECLEYLKYDCFSLKELFEKFNSEIYNKFGLNITNYTTISSLGYDIWTGKCNEQIQILKDVDKYNFCQNATYGARCYPNKEEYKSKHYDDVVNGRMTHADLKKSLEFLYNADATSLYPAAMAGFEHLKVRYPIGLSRWSSFPEKEFNDNKIGMYQIKYTPPTNLRIPILPYKTPAEGIFWTLEEHEGTYTSVDIQNALDAGYKIEFINKCLVWDESGNIFEDYVKTMFEMKNKAELEGNSVQKGIAKLLLNSLYGKMLQRYVKEHHQFVSSYVEFNKFCREYELTDWVIIDDNKILMKGIVKDVNVAESITKPSFIGAFVLAYSRSIMLFYMKEICPSLDRLIFTYSDTDSAHISGADYKILNDKGLIRNGEDKSLGFLSNDIDDDGIIISEKNCGPKFYKYEYISTKCKYSNPDKFPNHVCDDKTNCNFVYNNEDATLKLKGIPARCLKPEYYDGNEHVVKYTSLKKVTMNRSKEQKINGVNVFDILALNCHRTIGKSQWKKMRLIDGEFYPYGYGGDKTTYQDVMNGKS